MRSLRYNALTTRYFEAAAGAGVLEGARVGRGAAGSRPLGTWVQFDLEARNGRITAARFLAFGCPHTVAVCSRVTELAVGRECDPSLPDGIDALRAQFGVPVEKLGRLLTVEDAWGAAVAALPGGADA
jgi:hypothetical protein